jgi:hypothetical protein
MLTVLANAAMTKMPKAIMAKGIQIRENTNSLD